LQILTTNTFKNNSKIVTFSFVSRLTSITTFGYYKALILHFKFLTIIVRYQQPC